MDLDSSEHSINISKRKMYKSTGLPQATRKSSNNEFKLIPKKTMKRRAKRAKRDEKEEVIKIRIEMNGHKVQGSTKNDL